MFSLKSKLKHFKPQLQKWTPKQDFGEYAWRTTEEEETGTKHHYFPVKRQAEAYKKATEQDMRGIKVKIDKVAMPIYGGYYG